MVRGSMVFALLLVLNSAAPAQERHVSARLESIRNQRRALAEDRQEIQRYFYRDLAPLPRSIRREPLPPGVVKQLVRGRELPPGLEGEIEPLPRALEVRLNALDVSLQRGYVDGRVLVWERRTRRLVDVIEVADEP